MTIQNQCPHDNTHLWASNTLTVANTQTPIHPTIDCYRCGQTQLAPVTWHHNHYHLEIPTHTPPPPPTPITKHTNPTAIFQGTGNIAS